MVGVVGIGGGDAREHVLIAFARQEISILQGGLAEVGQESVARAVDLDLADELQLRSFRLLRGPLDRLRNLPDRHFAAAHVQNPLPIRRFEPPARRRRHLSTCCGPQRAVHPDMGHQG
jgi:hypothetical protein